MSADAQVPLSIDAAQMYMGVDADRVEHFFDNFFFIWGFQFDALQLLVQENQIQIHVYAG